MSADRTTLRRREFLKTAVPVAAGAIAISSTLGDEPPRKEFDVVIIGAGLAGLTAARELRKHDVRVCVLEARDRVGGRTLDHPVGDKHAVEGGGQWVGPTQTQVLALAKDLGVSTFKSYTKGKTVLSFGGRRLTAAGDDHDESEDMRNVKKALDDLAKEVPLSTPWNARRAKEWDTITVADWLKTKAKKAETRESVGLEVETALGPAARTSLLWYLFYLHSAGGTKALNTDAQELRFKGGPQAISKKMAADLKGDLFLSSPVKKIDASGGERVDVESKRVRVTAKRVVVAMMPADTRRIEFAPALPAARSGLVKAWVGEPGFKVNVVYGKPFWRDDGLSGLALSDRGPVGVTFDNSPPDGSRGVLLAFVEKKKTPKDSPGRRKAILEDLVALFGKAAQIPSDYLETDWSAEEWTSGCVSPLPPGVLTEFGAALREPEGRIHWAGTETSEVWCGYMDGAVRSGLRVATEVRKVL
jgi:monoamine oxidase